MPTCVIDECKVCVKLSMLEIYFLVIYVIYRYNKMGHEFINILLTGANISYLFELGVHTYLRMLISCFPVVLFQI